jgi:two-component system NarL family sensor kinase
MRQMLHLRDEELRGIARRLNTLNQYHAAVILNLDRLTRPETGPVDAAALATGSLQALQRCTADLHRLAEVLHPQALEQSGFAAAAEGYARAVMQRTGIAIQVNLPATPPERLPGAVETALFRVLEEGLSNVHHHSRAAKAEVTLQREKNLVVLAIRDYGRGMSAAAVRKFRGPGAAAHLGLVSLRERIMELGGELTMEAGKPGTVLRACVPISRGGTQRD